ncbi:MULTISPECIES: protein kinase domain-containing protein [unclassified Rhodococcus (in: high G+C Gram-positive bacteria)]|uniref:protein kinase domain-containing protein n=1 Tax=unclassified Rhodococcus (in: high G+C Gram-positive bacteria) TaxID=192944 RepID=UPI001639F267|nr:MULTISPECIES: protein kinase [unclassified Rhodococcus (in: high G+C Gram-positive bacteria)]MBC2640535.1 protein kinase [Rhodococcus sp. 3A]MBC2894719.1 protein kinase [Rhodococcus sp. 4CII]
MGEGDPIDTQRYFVPAVASELSAAGFDDAQEIGRGGFGVVYRCTQAELDRTVAVKVLTVELDEENRARFFREQRAMGRLTGHPNIVGVLQVGATGSGRPYIVMQYHPQDSLDVRIRRGGPLSLENVLRLGVKIAGAVETAHRLGILHRDIKPGNILLTDYGEPALTDFGIAHITGGFQTATGAVTGSPAYTAPEVLEGDPPSPAADVYGLGATLFSALTAHAAFERRDSEQVVAQFLRITTQPVPDLREHGIPDDVADTIARAMSRTPGARPATAAAFGEELRRLQLDHGIPVDEMALHTARGSARDQAQRVSKLPRSPAPSAPVATGRLPLELTSFVGRRHELTEAKNLLAGSRLVTLTGIGGVGKTRLAMRVASAVRREYADGVRLVELGELHDESSLVDTVAAAMGLRDHSGRPLREVLVEHLAVLELLLVLDNCEHLVDAVAELAGVLLHTCPGLRILATSREPLGMGGEALLRVPPLAVPDTARRPSLRGLTKYDAVSLFAERAAAAVPGFVLTEDNVAAVAGICRRLDGLPLPIELAAARLRAMSPEQILQRLTDRYALLTRGSRGAPTRQQTLRLSVDWSFELCSAGEQLVWGRVSVFAGSFELDAAEQVCGDGLEPDELLDTLTSLVEKSILIREESGAVVRFRMLETLREYGCEKLQQAGEFLSMRRLHRDWYEALALAAEAEWISAHQLDWIARLKREQPNLREALEFSLADDPAAGLRTAAALFLFWGSQGLYNEGRRCFGQLLARQSGPPTVERVKALQRASMMANVQGDLEAGAALVAEGRALAAHTSDPMMRALVAYSAGMLALYSGELASAASHLETALAEFSERGDRLFEVAALYPLGLAYGLRGLTDPAIEHLERVLAITQQHGEKMYRSHSSWALGIAVWRQGDTDRAVRVLEQSLILTRQVHGPRVAAAGLEALAWIACGLHDEPRAAVLLGAAEGLARSVGSDVVIYSDLLVYHDECDQKSRRKLGEKAFGAAHRKGEQLGFDAAIAYALHEHPPGTPAPGTDTSTRLTKRERQVADLVAEGLTNQAIADRLVISPRTAQGHVEHILAKLGFTSRAQVAAWVVEQTDA